MSKPITPLPSQVIILRPKHQAIDLAAAIQSIGLLPVLLPTIDIKTISLTSTALAEGKCFLQQADYVIVTSANVIDHIPSDWCHHLQSSNVITMGASTSQSLIAAGIMPQLTAKAGSTSETLLTAPCLQQSGIQQKSVVILTGKGGRQVLADTLKKRGATVHTICCYEAVKPDLDLTHKVQQWRTHGAPSLFVVTSLKTLLHLCDLVPLCDQHWLKSQPVMVVSQRIKDAASQLGFRQILMSQSPDTESLRASIQHWHDAKSAPILER